MSIRQVQVKNILDLISESYFISGVNPLLDDILKYVSYFFSQNPTGQPLAMSTDLFNGSTSDEKAMNEAMAKCIFNIDILYEALLQGVDEVMLLNTILRTHLERLRVKRSVLESKIDDYLLSAYNSDGYFHSISDDFTDTSLVDLNLTTAFIDTEAGTASIPAIADLSKSIEINRIGDPNIQVFGKDNTVLQYEVKSNFPNAIDGLTNTAWFFQVKVDTIQSVVAIVRLELSEGLGSTGVTKIEVTPFGVTPVKIGINTVLSDSTFLSSSVPFSNSVQTSTDKMIFIGDQSNANLKSLEFLLVKNSPDWTISQDTGNVYVYNFGFKELALTESVYDQFASVVSEPLSLPSEFQNDKVIDAVSLTVHDSIPPNASASYFIAADNPQATSIEDFDWIEITPVSGSVSDSKNKVISFNGTQPARKMIRSMRTLGSDLQLIPPDTTNADLLKRNPSPIIIPGADVYRVAEFKEEALLDSLTFEEGINTTKIYHTTLNTNAISEDFTFWSGIFENKNYLSSFGRIDSGHDTFYGGDVGESNRSVYMETYLYVDTPLPTLLKQCAKQDPNSKLWDVKVFLNGRVIATMPKGVDKLTIPWKFTQGKNHIAILVNIPSPTLEYPAPYLGSLSLMTDDNLTSFGTVKISDWNYVDFFKFQNNLDDKQNNFTIYNDEIITRKKVTDNIRVSFSKATQTGPESVRTRIDLSRSSTYSKVTPVIDSYRLRFSYK